MLSPAFCRLLAGKPPARCTMREPGADPGLEPCWDPVWLDTGAPPQSTYSSSMGPDSGCASAKSAPDAATSPMSRLCVNMLGASPAAGGSGVDGATTSVLGIARICAADARRVALLPCACGCTEDGLHGPRRSTQGKHAHND